MPLLRPVRKLQPLPGGNGSRALQCALSGSRGKNGGREMKEINELTTNTVHKFVANWVFEDNEHHEAVLANSIAEVADKNGLSVNDLQHIYPAILRRLRSDIYWAGQKKDDK
jgi:hypothetical protein